MRGWTGALRAAVAAPGAGPGPGGFRERFDFGGRDVTSWFPGHMAKGEEWERGGLTPPRCPRRRSPCAVLQACGRCGLPCGAPTASSRCTTLAYPLAWLFVSPGAAGDPALLFLPAIPVCPSRPFSLQPAPFPSSLPLLPVPLPSPALTSPISRPHPLLPCQHRPLSLATRTSHCRAVTLCCRRHWASAHMSWC